MTGSRGAISGITAVAAPLAILIPPKAIIRRHQRLMRQTQSRVFVTIELARSLGRHKRGVFFFFLFFYL